MPLLQRSKAKDYQGKQAGGLSGILRGDSFMMRVIIFLSMGLIFFFFLKITERRIPRGLAPDSTDTEMHAPVHPKAK